MKRFRYSAVDANGATKRGQIVAQDASAARGTLRAQGLLPVTVNAGLGWQAPVLKALGPPARSPKLSGSEQADFARQMATLLSNGVRVEAALDAIAQQTTPKQAAICRSLERAILDGKSFTAALQSGAYGFDRFFLTSVRAGERSGKTGPVLAYLAEHAEERLRNGQTVILALIYPAILVLVSLGVVAGLLVFVLPDIVRVFVARGADLPALTKLLISLSDGLRGYGPLLGIALVAVLLGGAYAARKEEAVGGLHRLLWTFGIARQFTILQFTRTLATLTQSGVALAEALPSAVETVGNSQARQLLGIVTQRVQDGEALSRALSGESRAFPPTLITMIASGEASGTLPAMLARFADAQSTLLQARVKTLVGLVEPLVLLVMGGVVMLIVLAILLPIVNLNSLVG